MAKKQNRKSKILNETLDIKHITIGTLAQLLQDELPNSFKLPGGIINGNQKAVLLTNFGTVKGTFLFANAKQEHVLYKIIRHALKVRDDLIHHLEKTIAEDNERVTNNTQGFVLKDAVIIPFANPEKQQEFPYLTLFSQDIVGFSLEDIES